MAGFNSTAGEISIKKEAMVTSHNYLNSCGIRQLHLNIQKCLLLIKVLWDLML